MIQLPLHDGPQASRPRSKAPLLLLLAVPALLLLHSPLSPLSSAAAPPVHDLSHHQHAQPSPIGFKAPQCPVQAKTIKPAKQFTFSAEYRDAAAQLLSEAVQQATISYDDNGKPTEDPRWAPFYKYNAWLQKAYPTVFEHPATTVEFVNTLGVLTTIQGSDKTLKPLMLMSHTDVTPAPPETFDRWTHPPYAGVIDDEFVWGRGASDDKTLTTAQYSALSLLLEDKKWTPRRTIILAHGFDEEEVHARQGAVELGKFLEARYGKDSILLAIDEGTTFVDGFGIEFAGPATSEKGYLDVKITVATEGGHSSVPFIHNKEGITAIGVMSEVVVALNNNPYPSDFKDDDPILAYLACAAEHGPDFPSKWPKLLGQGGDAWLDLADDFAALGPMQHALVTTTQAVDVINGGSKVNSMPEAVELLMNHRIQFTSSVNQTQAHIAKTLAPVAKKYKLGLAAFDGSETKDLGSTYIKIEVLGNPLEPAPRSVTSGPVWDLFSGSIKSAFPTKDGSERIVTPFASSGNTDTKAMHNLSKAVYRFKGETGSGGGFAHTVDERASIDGHLGIINWIATIVQNADVYDGEE